MPRLLTRSGPALALVTALALVAAGCGDDAPDAAAPAADAAVTVEGFAYDPDPVTVATGTTIDWTNEDSVAHTVTAGVPGEPDDAFDERLDGDGGTASITFDDPGTYTYFCVFHPQMTAEVVVE